MTIRDMQDDLHALLKERARRNRRSLNQQVIEELACLAGHAVGGDGQRKRLRAEELIGMVEGMRGRMKGFMTAEEIDRAKREGRA